MLAVNQENEHLMEDYEKLASDVSFAKASGTIAARQDQAGGPRNVPSAAPLTGTGTRKREMNGARVC